MKKKIAEHIKGHDLIQEQIGKALHENRLPHALLFSGPSGVGKRQLAWALAQNLLCEEPDSPCGHCSSCVNVLKRQSESVLCVTYDTLQIRLQDVQKIPPFLSLQSFAKAKLVLIDEAEKLNPQAGNFLLKIIEEPPPKSFFLLISSAPSKLSVTLRSRLQNLHFHALPEKLVAALAPEDTPEWIIRGSRGRMDLLEDLKDQAEIRSRSFDLWSEIFKKSFSALDFPHRIERRRKEGRKEALLICRFWQEILRDARFFKIGVSDQLIHGDKKEELKKLSQLPCELIDAWIKKSMEMEKDLQANVDYVLCFEKAVIDMQKNLQQWKLS